MRTRKTESTDERRDLTPEEKRRRTFERAVKLVAAKSRSVAELRERLLQSRQANKSDVEAVISRLKEYGYLDDERFAFSYASLKVKQRPIGRRRHRRNYAMISGINDDGQRCNGIVLNTDDPADAELLGDLRADARIEFVDNVRQQSAALLELRPSPPNEVTAEPTRWVYYPWRRTVVSVLGPRAFRLVRLDRNRNLITADELDRLSRLRIGVVGLSVGHAIAYTLAAQGLCGELRLTDGLSL